MKISTGLIILGMFIFALYGIIEVSYYSSQVTVENNITGVQILTIDKLNLTQSVNNKSVSYGIYYEPQSSTPDNGTVIIFGHRTLYGSPFVDLDKLEKGDKVYLDWNGVGYAKYTVKKSFIVPASYYFDVKKSKKLFLVTCHPKGSTKQRLVVQCDLKSIDSFKKISHYDNPNKELSWVIILLFLGVGFLLTRFYPIEEDKIYLLAFTLGFTIFLLLGYFFPTPPDFISSQLISIDDTINNFLRM